MKKLIISLLAIGITGIAYAQEVKLEELSEVVVEAVNYKYLSTTDNKEAAVPVKMLERKAAAYDVTTKDYYQDNYDYYSVSFAIPDGKLVAVYDPDGKILRTIEKFKDIQLPDAVSKALQDRFPNWEIVEDVYRIRYEDRKGALKNYKIKLQNGEKTMKVMMSEEGEFL
ncbi:nicotinate-nucleotide adenylyltransferase [Eudoraea sp.]|uniref:nicotinate-nucleotide adenylyltransferase n=1 Tax=Eudoraea sp. TaxID=1979955 RepID=UPI003C70ACA5